MAIINTVGTVFSNFAACTVTLDGVEYPSVEHAYQAAKLHPDDRRGFLDGGHEDYVPLRCGLHAKRLAKQMGLRPFSRERKLAVMWSLLRQKFSRESGLLPTLLATGDQHIAEVAPWDGFWGTGAAGDGENFLGRMLMAIRKSPDSTAMPDEFR